MHDSQSERANHGSPEATQDADPKRYAGADTIIPLKPIKMPNSDEVSGKLKDSARLDADRSPSDLLHERPSKTSWRRLNDDI